MHGDKHDAWDAEFCKTMALVEGVVRAGSWSPIVALRIASSVSWHAQYNDGAPTKSARKIIRLMPKSLEFRTTLALAKCAASVAPRLPCGSDAYHDDPSPMSE